MSPPVHRRINGWWISWFSLSLLVAVSLTAIDAFLLQRKWNYFTGGFLAQDHLSTTTQTIGFLVGSLSADGATAAFVVAILLSFFLWAGLSTRLAAYVAFCISLTPFLAADFVQYSILSFLGDRFDLQLMFDLTGRSIWEVLAVSDAHLASLAWQGAIALVVVVWFGRVVIRKAAGRLESSIVGLTPPKIHRAVIAVSLVLVLGSTAIVIARLSSDVIDAGMVRKPSVQVLSLGVSWLSDVDRDGYGILGRVSDSAPFDARIYPYALDIPGNGVDEDGVGGDLPADTPPYVEPPVSTAPWQRRPNVLLVMLESVRADVVGAALYGRPITPVLDALAGSGAKASGAFSHNGYTVQSRKHTFSGSLAGIRGDSTLIDDFRSHGYEVGYFSGQDESFGGRDGDVGFARADVAYDARSDAARRYSASTTPGSLAVPLNVVLERVHEFLSRKHDKPVFLYVNFHDTHFPYHHGGIEPLLETPILSQGEIVPSRAAELGQMYANTVANVDRAVGRLLQDVQTALETPPAVIVLSDHGESLFDQGFLGHGYDLADAQTSIPFIVSNLDLRIEEPVGESDLRDALLATLARPRTDGDEPSIAPRPDREVFQYLGVIDDPAQIGLRRLDSRIAYDFRSRRARVDQRPWIKPEALSAADTAEFLRLIRTWERMMLAKSRLRRQE